MSRIGTLLMAVAIVSALLAVPLGVSTVAADEPNVSVAPGERLAGVVGIQQAAVAGDLSDRTYEARLDRADSDAERAEIVAERRDEIERRLADHEAELAELRAAREAGNITEGTYRARVATLAAEKGSTERAAELASETARQLPAGVREARGVSVEELQQLRANASELGGRETAEIARDIGGPDASTPASARRGGPAAENHTGGPASAPARTTNGDEVADDRRAAKPGERTVGGSTGSTGSGADDGPRTDTDTQRDAADERNQPDTPTRNGPSDTTGDQKSTPPRDDDRPANSQ